MAMPPEAKGSVPAVTGGSSGAPGAPVLLISLRLLRDDRRPLAPAARGAYSLSSLLRDDRHGRAPAVFPCPWPEAAETDGAVGRVENATHGLESVPPAVLAAAGVWARVSGGVRYGVMPAAGVTVVSPRGVDRDSGVAVALSSEELPSASASRS